MRSLETIEEPARCHLSINVANLKRSIAFYKVLFGTEPSKCHDDYAKFDIDNPPTVFALVPNPVGHGGPQGSRTMKSLLPKGLRHQSDRISDAQ